MMGSLEEEHELLPPSERRAQHKDEDVDSDSDSGDDSTGNGVKQRSVWGEYCLFLQHLSSTLTAGAFDFALFLYLVEIFPNTIVPASLVGLATKLAGLVFANHMGGLVDQYPRLELLRWTIAAQKGFKLITFACLALLMLDFPHVWLAGVAVGSASLVLANTVLEVAIERDWVTAIAVDSDHLTQLNTRMRRIDLLSKLVAPLIVSLCTSLLTYPTTLLLLSLWVLGTCIAEYAWIHVVHRNLPILSPMPSPSPRSGPALQLQQDRESGLRSCSRTGGWWGRQKADWVEFMQMPIFASSLSIASIYLTTLSYDGTFIAYVKVARGHGDGFIALMRAVCVLTGLLGTLLMPLLERHIGLIRAGLWSISFELCCLLPAMLAFFIGTGVYGEHGPVGNQVLLFGGIAASRIGLWSFDLCQLKELQQALDGHPRRNRLTALQLALQNVFDLLKYAMTLAAARPSEFKWTAVGSVVAVGTGVACYAVYLRSMRGHLVHLDWIKRC